MEMLVVVALMAMVATYFTNLLIQRFARQEVAVITSELLTLSQAISNYYTAEFQWPGRVIDAAGDSVCESGNVFAALQPDYLNGYDDQDYSFSCSQDTHLVISITVSDEETANSLVSYLPAAESVASGSVYNVRLYVMRPRLPMQVNFSESVMPSSGPLIVAQPDHCANPAISVSPDAICAPNPNDNLGGYKVTVNTQGNNWRIRLRARSDFPSSDYQTIRTCPDEEGNPLAINFRAFIFCLR